MSFPSDVPPPGDVSPEVQFAYWRGTVAELKGSVEAQGKELNAQGFDLLKVVQSSQRADEWRLHYSEKIDQMHRSLVGNGGPGILTRLAVNEGEIGHVKEVLGIKVKSVKEGSIDWKTVAMIGLSVAQALLLVYLTTRTQLGG